MAYLSRPTPFNRLLLLCLLTPLASLPVASSGWTAPAEAYRYRQQSDGQTETFDWLLAVGDSLRLFAVSASETHCTDLDASLQTRRWSLRNPGDKTDVEARREGTRLVLSGVWKGAPVDETLRLDEAPWYQALSLSLRAFLASGKEREEFWTLRPDELKLLKLQVIRKGEEGLELDGQRIPAEKLEVRLTGLGALLGHSLYWFRAEDGLFLKYRGPIGLPGMATSQVTLEQKLPPSVSAPPPCGSFPSSRTP